MVKCTYADDKIETLEDQSMLLVDKKILSVVEYSDAKVLVHIHPYDLLVALNWQVVHRVSVSGSFQLDHCMIMPEFSFEDDFTFFISFGDKSYDLVNAKTGVVEPLIYGSANNILG